MVDEEVEKGARDENKLRGEMKDRRPRIATVMLPEDNMSNDDWQEGDDIDDFDDQRATGSFPIFTNPGTSFDMFRMAFDIGGLGAMPQLFACFTDGMHKIAAEWQGEDERNAPD